MVFWVYMESPKIMEAGTALIPYGISGTPLEPRRKHSARAVPPPVLNGTQVVPSMEKYKWLHKKKYLIFMDLN